MSNPTGAEHTYQNKTNIPGKIHLIAKALPGRRVVLASVLFGLSAVSLPLQSHGQVGAVAADVFISNLSDQLQARIDQAFDRSSILAFDVRSEAVIAAENLEFLASQFVGKTMDELNEQQRKAVNDAQRLIDSFDEDLDASLAALNEITVSMNDAFGTLPFSKTFPRVNSYTPNSFIAANGAELRVVANGSWIGYGDPTLVFGDVECRRQSKVERKIEFVCPSDLTQGNINQDLEGRLTVFGKRKHWFAKRQTRTYDVLVRPVPTSPATVELSWNVRGDVEERRSKEQSFGHRNSHCQGDRSFCWKVNADRQNDWSIDTSTVKARATTRSSNSSYSGVQNLSSSSYCIKAVVRNNGTCAPRVLGQRAYVDARGSVRVTTNYEETRIVRGVATEEADSQTAVWGSDLSFSMPENYLGFSATVKQYDGREKVSTQTISEDMFRVDVNENARIVVLRFKTPDEYLNASIR